MTSIRTARVLPVAGVVLCAVLGVALVHAQQSGKKEHQFRGKVEQVDTKAKTLLVQGEKVDGWMGAMTMSYGVDREEILKQIKAGDQITATVRDGDFKTLYDVRIVPKEKSK